MNTGFFRVGGRDFECRKDRVFYFFIQLICSDSMSDDTPVAKILADRDNRPVFLFLVAKIDRSIETEIMIQLNEPLRSDITPEDELCELIFGLFIQARICLENITEWKDNQSPVLFPLGLKQKYRSIERYFCWQGR